MTTEPGGVRPDRAPVDAWLRDAFSGEPVPGLSPEFEARLERRLVAEGLDRSGSRPPLSVRDRWFLAGYWFLAALASVAVVSRVHPGPVPWPALVAVALTAVGLAVPFLALRRAASF